MKLKNANKEKRYYMIYEHSYEDSNKDGIVCLKNDVTWTEKETKLNSSSLEDKIVVFETTAKANTWIINRFVNYPFGSFGLKPIEWNGEEWEQIKQ